MDFKVVQKEIELQSRGWIPTFHDITADVHKIVSESGVVNGTSETTLSPENTTTRAQVCIMVSRLLNAQD